MTITVLSSTSDHMVVAGIYNNLHLLSILDNFCLPQAPQLIEVLYLAE